MKRREILIIAAAALILILTPYVLLLVSPSAKAMPSTTIQTALPSLAMTDAVEAGWEFVPFTTTATNPVTGWYHVDKGRMYDKVNNTLAAAPTWTDCVTAISIDNTTGIYEDSPESTMESGWYIWRLWDSASPAYTDTEVKAKLIYWSQQRRQITQVADL